MHKVFDTFRLLVKILAVAPDGSVLIFNASSVPLVNVAQEFNTIDKHAVPKIL
jgi:hypothetical protein